MIRPDPIDASRGRVSGRAAIRVLVAAVMLLAGAVVGLPAHASAALPDRLAPITTAAHPDAHSGAHPYGHTGGDVTGAVVLVPVRGQPARTPAPGSVPAAAPGGVLVPGLLAGLLLALVAAPAVPSLTARALPRRRGPPLVALPH